MHGSVAIFFSVFRISYCWLRNSFCWIDVFVYYTFTIQRNCMQLLAVLILLTHPPSFKGGGYLFSGSDSMRPAYVFIIDINKRRKKSQVSRLRNWECIGTAEQVTARCGPGHLQACQLIVDERDTYIESGKRILKPEVKIIASKAESFWYVAKYISPTDNPYEINNERDE